MVDKFPLARFTDENICRNEISAKQLFGTNHDCHMPRHKNAGTSTGNVRGARALQNPMPTGKDFGSTIDCLPSRMNNRNLMLLCPELVHPIHVTPTKGLIKRCVNLKHVALVISHGLRNPEKVTH